MTALVEVVRRAPLASYCGVAFLFTWSLLPFASRSVVVSLVALVGPAVAAFAVTALLGGQERRAFARRVGALTVPPRWYLIALLLPLPVSALRSAIEYTWGASGPIAFQPISVLSLVLFLLVAGEEVGWRGFALPRLLPRAGPWGASLMVGVIWALWHLPLFRMPAMPQFGTPFPAFTCYTVALSLILTWLLYRSGGSVVIATVFHGAVNTLGLVNTAATPTQRGWANALSYGLAALILGAQFRRQAKDVGVT